MIRQRPTLVLLCLSAALTLAAGVILLTGKSSPEHALYEAIAAHREDLVDQLIADGADVNTTVKGMPLLYVAAESGCPACVQKLLAAGAHPHPTPEWRCATPLHRAVTFGHAENTRLLLQAGAEKNAADEGGNTPLHLAAQRGASACVEALLDAGAKPDPVNDAGESPLHLAAAHQDATCVRLLLAAGAKMEPSMPPGKHPCTSPRHGAAGIAHRPC